MQDAGKGAALVTGASVGIGAAVVDAFRAEGRPVVAGDTPPPTGWASDQEVRPVQLDVTSRADQRAAVATAREAFGGLQTVVTHAFVGWPEAFLDISEESWDELLAVNLKGAFLTIQEALPHLSPSGSVVVVSSIAARRSSTVMGAHYTAARYALVGLTRHLAVELAGRGIRVNAVCPGPPDAPSLVDHTSQEERDAIVARTPLRRLAKPGDVADAVAFLAGPRAAHIHGAVLDVNGGLY